MEYSYQNSVIAQILEAIINASTYEGETGSNIADILLSILNETPYEGEANSVLAELFLELKAKIEGDPFTPYEGTYSGHIAEILLSILNETEYDKEPQSRIAELLLQLKEELEAYTEVTKSGAIANFTTNVSKPLVNLTAYFKATQEAGTPTPQSPKAISGVSAVSVTKCGKNLFDKTNSGSILNTYFNASVISSDFSSIMRSVFVKCKPSTKYTVSKNSGQRFSVAYTKEMPEANVSVYGNVSNNTASSISITTGSDAKYLVAFVYNANVDSGTAEDMLASVQIEEGNATTYEPYNGSTTLINLGGTYYGGYVSQDKDGKRELTITYSILMDMGSLEWSNLTPDTSIFTVETLENCKAPDSTQDRKNGFLCSIYPPSESVSISASMSNKSMLRYGVNNNGWIVIRDTAYSDATQLATALSGAKLIYELAEPFKITLPDGVPITAFNGVNNIYNDSGDTSVTYLYKGEPPLQSPLGFGLGSSNSDPEEENIEEDTPIEETENSEEEA